MMLYNNDPLANWFIHRWRLTPIKIAFLSVIITLSIPLCSYLVVWLGNALLSKSEQIDVLKNLYDPNYLVWCFLLQPVIFGYYLWSVGAIKNLVEKLIASEVIEIPDEEIQSVLSIYQKPWRKFLALGIAVLTSSILVFSTQLEWIRFGGIIIKIFALFAHFVDTYTTTVVVLILLMNIWILQKILKKKELNVNPLHPDRCGGLKPLSEYSLKTAYLAAVFGVTIGFSEYCVITWGEVKTYWLLHFGVFLYIVLSLGCFFGPLLAAHTVMQNAKERLLINIAKQFQDDYHRVKDKLSHDSESIKKELAKIHQLRSFYRLTDEFPVWPFDLKTFRRYLLSVSTPLIPVLIALLQQLVKYLLGATKP